MPGFSSKVPAGHADDDATRKSVQNWQARGVPVLAESWNTGRGIGADLLVGAGWLPSSPGRRQIPGHAGGGTAGPGHPDFRSCGRRYARHVVTAQFPAGARARAKAQLRRGDMRPFPSWEQPPPLSYWAANPNGLPPGLALHAELRALAAAGLRGDQVLQATGSAAAMILGLDNQIGRITPGAAADLVLVNGDPLGNAMDALSIVAVVRNGRFFSLVSLLERAKGHRRRRII